MLFFLLDLFSPGDHIGSTCLVLLWLLYLWMSNGDPPGQQDCLDMGSVSWTSKFIWTLHKLLTKVLGKAYFFIL